jgi:hypothetical protein
VSESLLGLKELKPSLVVIASSSTWYLSDPGRYFRSPSGEIGRTPDEKARLWTQALGSVVQDLTRAEIPAVVVHTIPEFGDFDLRNCPRFLLGRAAEACGRSLTRSQVEAQQRLGRTAEEAAIRGLPLVSAVDFTADLCDGAGCHTNRGTEWLYRNGGHLSVSGALTLAGHFDDLIRAHAVPASGATPPGA